MLPLACALFAALLVLAALSDYRKTLVPLVLFAAAVCWTGPAKAGALALAALGRAGSALWAGGDFLTRKAFGLRLWEFIVISCVIYTVFHRYILYLAFRVPQAVKEFYHFCRYDRYFWKSQEARRKWEEEHAYYEDHGRAEEGSAGGGAHRQGTSGGAGRSRQSGAAGPPPEDPYAVLGLERGASKEQIKQRFRELAKKHHPDRGGDAKEFMRVKRAYEKILRQVS